MKNRFVKIAIALFCTAALLLSGCGTTGVSSLVTVSAPASSEAAAPVSTVSETPVGNAAPGEETASGETESAPAEPTVAVSTRPASLTLTNPDFFGGSDSSYKTDWLADFETATGVPLTVTVPALEDGQTYAEWVIANAQSGALTGLVRFESVEQLLQFKNAGILSPLDSLIDDETVCDCPSIYGSLPADFTSALSFGGGTWGIPAAGNYTIPWVRSYNTAWLTEAGLTEAPDTVLELRSFLSWLIANKDCGLYTVSTAGLADIFAAYDAPLSEYGTNLGYSVSLNNVVDTFLLDGAEAALEYLRTLYRAGCINLDFLTDADYAKQETAFSDGKAGTAYFIAGALKYVYGTALYGSAADDSLEKWNEAVQTYTDGRALEGASQAITVEVSGYCLIRGSAEAAQSVNFLLDCLWGSRESWQLCSLGTAGYSVDAATGDILCEYRSSSNHTAYPMPNLCSTLPGLFNAADNIRFFTDSSDDTKTITRTRARYYADLVTAGLADGSLYVVHPLYYGVESEVYALRSTQINAAVNNLLTSAITDTSVTVAQALQTYRTTMQALGGDTVLDQANAALGLYPVQSYTLPDTTSRPS